MIPSTEITHSRLYDWVVESNRIEGIIREPKPLEIEATNTFVNLLELKVADFCHAVMVMQPGAELRNLPGMNVQVGSHIPIGGGPVVVGMLVDLLQEVNRSKIDRFHAHVRYEMLHPFMDGNGRSGRLLYLWMYTRETYRWPELGFLHHWYYDTLANHEEKVKRIGK